MRALQMRPVRPLSRRMNPDAPATRKSPWFRIWYPSAVGCLSIGLVSLALYSPSRETVATIQGTYLTDGVPPGDQGPFALDVLEDGEARVSYPGYQSNARYRYQDDRMVIEAHSEMGARVTWVFDVEHRSLVSGDFRLERLTD